MSLPSVGGVFLAEGTVGRTAHRWEHGWWDRKDTGTRPGEKGTERGSSAVCRASRSLCSYSGERPGAPWPRV